MGVFVEEHKEFVDIHNSIVELGNLNTNNSNHINIIDNLRNWMINMADMRLGKPVIKGNTRTDAYFIGWEEQDGTVAGTQYEVTTTNQHDGKIITTCIFNTFFGSQALKVLGWAE